MTTTTPPVAVDTTTVLRRLYLVRFVVALVWAVAVFVAATRSGPVTAVLLVLYPLFDVGAAVVDARTSRDGRTTPGLRVNIALSLVAAVGLAVAVTAGDPAVLRVWGAWAVLAGLVQLVVALRRRALGGQWAMIASGSLSTVAGAAFVAQASATDPALTGLAGYALLGGVFFLVSSLRLTSR